MNGNSFAYIHVDMRFLIICGLLMHVVRYMCSIQFIAWIFALIENNHFTIFRKSVGEACRFAYGQVP